MDTATNTHTLASVTLTKVLHSSIDFGEAVLGIALTTAHLQVAELVGAGVVGVFDELGGLSCALLLALIKALRFFGFAGGFFVFGFFSLLLLRCGFGLSRGLSLRVGGLLYWFLFFGHIGFGEVSELKGFINLIIAAPFYLEISQPHFTPSWPKTGTFEKTANDPWSDKHYG